MSVENDRWCKCGLQAPPIAVWEYYGFRGCPRCSRVWPEYLVSDDWRMRQLPTRIRWTEWTATAAGHAYRWVPLVQKPTIIGLTGKKGSGKDTVANILVANYGFRRIALADKLKEVCADVFGLTSAQVHGSIQEKEALDERWGKSPREILQHIGTEGFRAVNDEVWLRYVFRYMAEFEREYTANDVSVAPPSWVISDVRFVNEAKFITDRGGVIWKVDRPGLDKGVGAGHSSETEIDRIVPAQTILNDASMRVLDARVTLLLENTHQ